MGNRTNDEGRLVHGTGMVRVLVAVDDTDASLRAARTARLIFGDSTQFFVVNVGATEMSMWGGDPMTWGVPYPLVEIGREVAPFAATVPPSPLTNANRAFHEANAVTKAADLPSHSVPLGVTGDPVDQICQVAQDESIDLIVVGSGGSAWWRRLFEPSVSKALVRQADRPVLVVP